MAKQVSVVQLDAEEIETLKAVGDKQSVTAWMTQFNNNVKAKRQRLQSLLEIPYLGQDQLTEIKSIVALLKEIGEHVPDVDDASGDGYAVADYKRSVDMAMKQLDGASEPLPSSQQSPDFPS